MPCVTYAIPCGVRHVSCVPCNSCVRAVRIFTSRLSASHTCAIILTLIPLIYCRLFRHNSWLTQRTRPGCPQQRKVERTAGPLIAGEPDVPTVCFDNRLCNEQTKANSRILTAGSIAHTVETLKDVVEVLRTDTNTLIGHTDQVIVVLLFQFDRHLPPEGREPHGIIQYIADYLANTRLIRHNFAILHLDIKVNRMLLRAYLGQPHTLCQ